MRTLASSWVAAVVVLVPAIVLLVGSELLHAVPAHLPARLLRARRAVLAVTVVFVVLTGILIVVRFVELRT